MDAEKITEVLKNIKLTGELNSETVEKVSKEVIPQIMPLFWAKEILGRLESIVWIVAILCAIAMIVPIFIP